MAHPPPAQSSNRSQRPRPHDNPITAALNCARLLAGHLHRLSARQPAFACRRVELDAAVVGTRPRRSLLAAPRQERCRGVPDARLAGDSGPPRGRRFAEWQDPASRPRLAAGAPVSASASGLRFSPRVAEGSTTARCRHRRAIACPQATDRRTYRIRMVFAPTGAIRTPGPIGCALRQPGISEPPRHPVGQAERLGWPSTLDSHGDDRPGSRTSQSPKRSGASSRVLLGSVSKQQREFGRLPQSPISRRA
jgi:hypothetical protein